MVLGYLEDELNQIYAHKFLQSSAMGALAVFVPIYLLIEGFSWQTVSMYLVIDVLAFTVFALPSGYFISRVGNKYGLLAAYFFLFPAFLILRFLALDVQLVLLVGLLSGLGKSMHYIPLNAGFTQGSQQDTRGSDTGKLAGLPKIASSLAPIIAALILKYLGFHALVSTAILLSLLSIIPLFLSGFERRSMEYRPFSHLGDLRLQSVFVLDGSLTTAAKFLFPLFVFFVVEDIVKAGAAKTGLGLGMAFFAFVVGNASDRLERDSMIAGGLTVLGLLFAAVSFVEAELLLYAVAVMSGMMYLFYEIPLFSRVADIGDHENVLGYYAIREVSLGIGKLMPLTLLLFFAGTIHTGFRTAFLTSAVMALLLSIQGRKI